MQSLKNLSVRLKLRIVVAVLALLFVLATLNSQRGLSTLDEEMQSLGYRYYPAISLVLNGDRDFYQALVAQRDYIALGPNADAQMLADLKSSHDENFQQTLDRGTQAIGLLNNPPVSVNELTQALNDWKRQSDAAMADFEFVADLSSFDRPRDMLDAIGEYIDTQANTTIDQGSATLADVIRFQIIYGVALFSLLLLVLYSAPRLLINPINRLRDRMQNIGNSNSSLSERVPVNAKDEYGQLSEAFNHVLDRLEQSFTDIKAISAELSQQGADLIIASNDNQSLAEIQFEKSDATGQSIENLNGSVQMTEQAASEGKQYANNAASATQTGRDTAEQANHKVEQLAQTLSKTSSSIQQLADEADSIGAVLDVIQGIAEQTNLLALNAAIEAARAGEQGRGFAVVADEVRSLASKTQQSTEDIKRRIDTLQKGVSDAVEAMQRGNALIDDTVSDVSKTTNAFGDVASQIDSLNQQSMDIADSASHQQAMVIDINDLIDGLRNSAMQSDEKARELGNIAARLEQVNKSLEQIVERFSD